ncbi:MAG: regulatory iron-sulfur-containing complex subunit RicT [Bdellovibrionota bacterium]
MPGINIVGVQFRRAGKIYDFDAREFPLALGDKVVVETERGPSLAEVKRIQFVESALVNSEALKPITRLASGKDQESAGRLTGEHSEQFTKQKIKDLNLDMRVINVEIQFGGNKVIVYFSAPGRVDFRELVKELAGGLKTRVELKQVGARDEAKLAGGLGICGREFCCSSFLREFVPVSIKMAKNQNLALNPSKVSGGCGRLLCCLTYEDETYSALRQRLLPKGARVRLQEGILGDVVRGDILNQVMQVELDTGELRTVPISELEVVEAKAGLVEDDWGSDLNFGSLMGGGDIASLDDSEEISRHRESAAEPISGGQKPVGDRPQRVDRKPDIRSPKPQAQGQGPRDNRAPRENRAPRDPQAQTQQVQPQSQVQPQPNRAPREPRPNQERGPRPNPAPGQGQGQIQSQNENRAPRGDRKPKAESRPPREQARAQPRPQPSEKGEAPQIIKPRTDKKED